MSIRPVHLALLLFVSLTEAILPRAAADEPIPPLALFALPKAALKTELKAAPQPHHTSTNHTAESPTNLTSDLPFEDFSLLIPSTSIATESSIQSFETMNGGRVLRAIERPAELGGAAGWLNENVWDPVFAPEVVKIGKVKITGGLVAAIKRKNPFCLLHPLVFAAGW